MVSEWQLAPGTKVRIKSKPSGIQLRTDTGEIVRYGEQAGYVIVRLDEPAISYDDPENEEDIIEIIEATDNLDVIESAR